MLRGIKVIEFSGLAPAPFCGKILSDFGAHVVRIDRPNAVIPSWLDDNKRSIYLNLKNPSAVNVVKKMCQCYDILIDPYRPGILEKMGLGPAEVHKQNSQMIFARLSGYGQFGPLSTAAGHDINYLAISGILSALGRKENVPTPPANLLADFAGGGLLCAFGIILSLFDRTKTGKGQVVDLSMAEGAAYVGAWLYSTKNSYLWPNPRGENWLDSGAHFYETYETSDGKFMVVGAVEAKFYNQVLQGLGLHPNEVAQMDNLEENKALFAAKFKEKTQDEWCKIFSSLDACVSPVLSMNEAPVHPHNVVRGNFRRVKGHWEPVPAPRLTDFSGTLNEVIADRQRDDPHCPVPGEHTYEILKELNYSDEEIKIMSTEGAVDLGKAQSKL